MHKLPKDKAAWIHAILKGRKDLKSEKDIHKNCYICSIHFRDGKPAKNNPYLFLTLSTIMLPTLAKSRKPCKRAVSTQTSKANLKKRLVPPNEQNFFVISPSTPWNSESQCASDVRGIAGELNQL